MQLPIDIKLRNINELLSRDSPILFTFIFVADKFIQTTTTERGHYGFRSPRIWHHLFSGQYISFFELNL